MKVCKLSFFLFCGEATYIQAYETLVVESLGSVPHFALSKWASKGSGKGKDFSTGVDSEMDSPLSPQLRYRGVSGKKSYLLVILSSFFLCVSSLAFFFVISCLCNLVEDKPSAKNETLLAADEEVSDHFILFTNSICFLSVE